MKTRRIMALLLACVMVMGTMLTGCGQKEQKSEESKQSQQSDAAKTSESQDASTEEVEKLEPYTVTYWMRGEESKDHDKVMELVNARIQEFLPNTTLDIVWVANSEYKDRWNKALAAGEKIDIGWSASWVNDPYVDVENEVVMPVGDLLDQYGQGIIEAIGGQEIRDMHRIKDEEYFILAWQGLVGGRKGLYLNKKLADAMPEGWLEGAEKVFLENQEFTVEDVMANCDKLEEALIVNKEKDICVDGMKKGQPTTLVQNGVVLNDGYRLVVTEKDGVFTVQSWYDNPVYKAFLERMHEWYDKGYYAKDILLKEYNSAWQETESLWISDAVSDGFAGIESTKRGFDMEACLVTPVNSISQGFSTGVVFPITGENPERSMQVLNLLYTDAELYRLLVYGIEGTHYITNSNGTITRPASGDRDYQGVTNWTLGTCINGLPESEANIGQYEKLAEAQKVATISPLLGFSFSAADAGVKAEQANLDALRQEYDACYLTDDFETRYAEFCKKQIEVGLDKYIAAYKEALSKYVTENNLGTVAP